MKDLYRCLEDQLPELLSVIAEAWRVTLPNADPTRQWRPLADAMLAPGALTTILAELTPEALALLHDLVRAGGVVPAHRLEPAYGSIRRDGPARLLREQPWRSPASALEELYFKGLVDRSNASIGGYIGQVVLVPTQFVERLAPAVSAPEPLQFESLEPPAAPVDDDNALVEDLFALLVAVRHNQVTAAPRTAEGAGTRAWPAVDLSMRLQGASHPARLSLITQLAFKLGLLREVEGWLRPGPRAREWLRISDERRARSLFLGWRDDRRWNELHQIADLRIEEAIDLAASRRALLEVLAACPAERWISTGAFLEALKRRRPDWLRGDADYVSWRVSDATTGQQLTGPASWDHVEGAVAVHLLSTSLRWLGLVALSDAGAHPKAFRLTTRGALLTARSAAAPPADPTSSLPPASIDDDLTVRIGVHNSLYERWQLERFAQWEKQDDLAHYRVTATSLWRGYNSGIEVAQVIRFLARLSGDQLPPAALRELHAWGGHFGRASLREMLLLEVDNEHTMKQITSRGELRALLGHALSPTTCLVERSQMFKLLQELEALGIWPKLLG